MLQLSGSITNKQILSLRSGAIIADLSQPIINPNNLKIEGWYCRDSINKRKLILLNQDVRQIAPRGIVVNDHEVLSEPGDLVRLKSVLELSFSLINKSVITLSKKKVGKVSDFTIDSESFFVQKLYVTQPILKNIRGGSLSIDRTQIVEITNSKITIKDSTETASATAPLATPA